MADQILILVSSTVLDTMITGWGYDCRQQASGAAKRAQVLEEYLLRKREAAAYKARGQQWLMVRQVSFALCLIFNYPKSFTYA